MRLLDDYLSMLKKTKVTPEGELVRTESTIEPPVVQNALQLLAAARLWRFSTASQDPRRELTHPREPMCLRRLQSHTSDPLWIRPCGERWRKGLRRAEARTRRPSSEMCPI